MEILEYSRAAQGTAIYPNRHGLREDNLGGIHYVLHGLTGELGELAQLVKKYVRDGGNKADLRAAAGREIGDLLWYVNAAATEFDLSLSDIATENLDKLAGRAARGTLQGSGESR